MEGQGQEIPKIREQQQKERLSDEEMGNLISALGNHEAKAIVLCLMTPGIIYPRYDLYRAVIQAQGQNKGWRMDHRGPFQYCEASLSPIGLVTREAINPDLSTYGYMKTEYGDEIGVSLAGLLLDFSLRHPDFSLQDFFGRTGSSSVQKIGEMEYKKRAPTTRLKIFWELLTSNLPLRATDITERIGESSEENVGLHLSELAGRGLISYVALKYGEAQAFYRLSETPPSSEPEAYRRDRGLTSFVYKVLRGDGSSEWSAEAIQERYQQYLEAQAKPLPGSEVNLKSRISSILSHLAQKGYARRGKFTGGKIHSEANLTGGQREVLLELVTLIDRFQNQDPTILELGKRLTNRIIANPERVSLLLIKAREHSNLASRRPGQEIADDILRIISSRPDWTTEQIRKALEEEGRRLSTNYIHALIRPLITNRRITRITIRGVGHFNLADKT